MSTYLKSNRLEAFSDGVLAIIITIMVLEFKIPHTKELKALFPLLPVFISYLLSFIHIAIYWNNHHHLFRAAKEINGNVMWANMNFLFWISMLPFATAWMGENNFTKWPVFVYGCILTFCGLAYLILTRALVSIHEKDSVLVLAVSKNSKETYTIAIYMLGLILCFVQPVFSLALYFAIAILWFIPDKRIEEKIIEKQDDPDGEKEEIVAE